MTRRLVETARACLREKKFVLALIGSVSFALASVSLVTADPRQPTPSLTSGKLPQAGAPAPGALVAETAAPTAAVRTETITYDVWTVSCRDTPDGKTKKICSATLPMQMQQEKQRVNLGAWLIAHNNTGALVSIVQTPQVDIGVLIAKGVELKLGNAAPHKLNFIDCNPQRCEALMPMDQATIKEALASTNAVVTFWKADGSDLAINIQSIKGIENAISAVTRP